MAPAGGEQLSDVVVDELRVDRRRREVGMLEDGLQETDVSLDPFDAEVPQSQHRLPGGRGQVGAGRPNDTLASSESKFGLVA